MLVRDGNLVLRAERRTYTAPDGRVFPYTSGMVSSGRTTYDVSVPPRFAASHVYVEIRAKIPVGRGLWPALWLLPANNTELPEIDVMEIIGQRPDVVHMNLHVPDENGDRRVHLNEWTSPEPLDDWHVYAMDWTPEVITWYVDGVRRASEQDAAKSFSEGPMYLIANLAVGGNWPGPPDDSVSFPADFLIDYVRVWRRE